MIGRYDARTERWQPMEIRGVYGYFSDYRINKGTIPDNFHFWELADGDCDGIPCRYKPGILVNFYGTFITTGELPVDDPEHNEGFISENEYDFLGNPCLSLDEIIKKERLIMDVSRFNLLTRCEFSDMFDEVSEEHDHINSQEYPVCEVGYIRGYYRDGWEDVYFPVHKVLLTPEIKEEANALYNTVIRKWFPTLDDLVRYCEKNALERVSESSYNFYVMCDKANYWFRFITRPNDYNIYMHIFKKGGKSIENK